MSTETVISAVEYAIYERTIYSFRVYPPENLLYLPMGLYSEIGEVNDKQKKYARDGKKYSVDDILLELGDALFYVVSVGIDADCRQLAAKINFAFENMINDIGIEEGTLSNSYAKFSRLENYLLKMSFECACVAEYRRRMVVADYTHDAGVTYRIPRAIVSILLVAKQFSPDISLSDLMIMNMDKLNNRQKTDNLHGSGDHRGETPSTPKTNP